MIAGCLGVPAEFTLLASSELPAHTTKAFHIAATDTASMKARCFVELIFWHGGMQVPGALLLLLLAAATNAADVNPVGGIAKIEAPAE